MGISKKCILKSTSNQNYMYLIGKEGELSIGNDGVFRFQFIDDNGQINTLASGVQTCLGSLEHPASKEICFQTRNSVYVFDKKEFQHGLWGAEREQLFVEPTISYEDYAQLRNSAQAIRNGSHVHLTFKEQDAVLKRWEAVNKSIQEGKTTILPSKAHNNVGFDR